MDGGTESRRSVHVAAFVVAVLLAAVLAPGPAGAQASSPVVFVDAGASGADTGSSWSDAFTSLDAALAVALPGSEVRIAAGVYVPTSRERGFSLAGDLRLMGGFPPGGGTIADPLANPTVLSGDLLGDDPAGGPPGGDNAYHVVVVAPGATVVLEGLIIEGGNAWGETRIDDQHGGGLRLLGSASAELRNTIVRRNAARTGGGFAVDGPSRLGLFSVTVEDNSAANGAGGFATTGSVLSGEDVVLVRNRAANFAGGLFLLRSRLTALGLSATDNAAGTIVHGEGGAIYADGSTVVLEGSELVRNTADLGGGIAGRGGSGLSAVRSVFHDNRAGSGGAVHLTGSTMELTDSVLNGNTATSSHGGAIADHDFSRVTVVGSTISGNTAAHHGGGLFNDWHSEVDIVQSDLSGNTAHGGGGFFNHRYSTSRVVDSRIERNSSTGGGGGVYNNIGSTAILTNSLLTGNRAALTGGAMINLANSTARLTNVTVAGNVASASSLAAVENRVGSTLEIGNSIVWGNAPASPGIADEPGSSTFVRASIVERATQPGALDVDPLFTTAGDYRLEAASPARDLGIDALVPPDLWDVDADGDTAEPAPDLASGTRIRGLGVDLGAYELASLRPRASVTAVTLARTGAPVSFDGSASVDPDGSIVRYEWSWGDGSPTATGGSTATHVYRTAGLFEACLVVTDSDGVTDRACVTVVVYAALPGRVAASGEFVDAHGSRVEFQLEAHSGDEGPEGELQFEIRAQGRDSTPWADAVGDREAIAFHGRDPGYLLFAEDAVLAGGSGVIDGGRRARYELWIGLDDFGDSRIRVRLYLDDTSRTVLVETGTGGNVTAHPAVPLDHGEVHIRPSAGGAVAT